MKELCRTFPKNSFSHWITDKYIYIMLLVYPLFTGFWGYAHVTDSRFFFFAGFTGIWVIALLIGHFLPSYSSDHRRYAVKILLLLFLGVSFLSAVLSPYGKSVLLGESRYNGLLTTFLYICIFLGVSKYARPRICYVYALGISVSLNCLVAILQLLGMNPLGLFPGDYTYYDAGTRLSSEFLGFIGNADLFSALLCLGLPLCAGAYICGSKRRLSLLVPVALSIFCIFASEVAAGKLSIILCLLLGAPFMIKDGASLRKALEFSIPLALSSGLGIAFHGEVIGGHPVLGLSFSLIPVCLIIVSILMAALRVLLDEKDFSPGTLPRFFATLSVSAVVFGLVAVYLFPPAGGTLHELSGILHGHFNDKFGSSRILIWRKTLELVPEKLLLGGGPGTLPLRLDIEFSRVVEETGRTLSCRVDNAHNLYLGILADTGIFSLIFYMAAQILSLYKAVRLRLDAHILIPLALALVCYWIQDFFGLGMYMVSAVMWVLWGLLCSDIYESKASALQFIGSQPETISFDPDLSEDSHNNGR